LPSLHFHQPWSLATDAAGRLYVADRLNLRIAQVSPAGELLQEWHGFTNGDSNAGPMGVALDPQGTIYASDPRACRILVFAPDGRLLRSWGSI
jgi:sugar lactone lactonase YvrE